MMSGSSNTPDGEILLAPRSPGWGSPKAPPTPRRRRPRAHEGPLAAGIPHARLLRAWSTARSRAGSCCKAGAPEVVSDLDLDSGQGVLIGVLKPAEVLEEVGHGSMVMEFFDQL